MEDLFEFGEPAPLTTTTVPSAPLASTEAVSVGEFPEDEEYSNNPAEEAEEEDMGGLFG
jgi:ribosomal protein L12E/L44/L45/RPP1/RPP2